MWAVEVTYPRIWHGSIHKLTGIVAFLGLLTIV
jgi:hypothetical protein